MGFRKRKGGKIEGERLGKTNLLYIFNAIDEISEIVFLSFAWPINNTVAK